MICRAKSLLTNKFVEGGFVQGKNAWIVQIRDDGSFSHILVDPETVEPVWIPVTERLPESGKHVLVACECRSYGSVVGKYVCDGYYAAPKTITGGCGDDCATEYDEEDDNYYLLEGWYEIIKNWDDYNSIVIPDFVTHWMPLPEPPKEDGHGE